ncbi:MAG: hypothetical protein DCC58_15805 [Chloroflexi bacterium]|nr:MAG: hypothetical protein DCC58_15805 [Chloroflexota bacterium]
MTRSSGQIGASTRLDLPLDDLQVERLRSGLRAAFPADVADRIASAAPQAATARRAYRGVIASARRTLLVDALLARVGRGPAPDPDRPFVDARSTPAVPALALLLHLSCDLDGEELADLLGKSLDDLGRDLLVARRVIDPRCPRSCNRFAPAIGRCRDRRLDAEDRLELLGHCSSCDACRRTLEFVRSLDDDLLGELARLQGALRLPIVAKPRRTMPTTALAAVVGVAALVLALFGLAALLNRTTVGDLPPAPISAGHTSSFSGWVLSVGQNGLIEAFNLATGETRELRKEWTAPSSQWGTVALVAPDHRLLAVARVDSSGHPANSRVDFMTLDGEMVAGYELEGERAFQYPVGWLDSDTLLLVSYPLYDEDMEAEYDHLLQTATRLFSIDVVTGARTDLLIGNVGGAVVAPTGDAIAVIGTYDGSVVGQTVTVYAIENGQIGRELVVVESRVRSNPIWASDGSAVVMTVATHEAVEAFRSSSGGPMYQGAPVHLLSVGRQGNQHLLADGAQFLDAYPFAVGPAAETVLLQARSSSYSALDAVWMVGSDGTQSRLFEGSEGLMYNVAIPAPDGSAMLVEMGGVSFITPGGQYGGVSTLTSQSLVIFDAQGRPQRVRTDYTVRGQWAFAWIPEAALASRSGAPSWQEQGAGYGLEPVADFGPEVVLGTTGSMNQRGGYIVVVDNELGVPMIWDLAAGRARRLGGAIEQLRWTGDGNELLGVARADPLREIGSRIGIIGNPATSNGVGMLPPPFLDPALLGAEQVRRYALPLLAPDGNQLAFFVVNPESRIIELWLAGWERPAAPISRFRYAPDAVIDIHVAATWVDSSTIIFAQPAGWADGLPRQIEIMRVNTRDPANPVVDRVTTIPATGADRGVILREFSLSPSGDELAWRIRHYKERAADRGRVDSIEVVAIANANARLEVARANPGDGLSWAPDGQWLAVGLARRIALLSPDGRVFEYLTPKGIDADRPVWVRDDELWFNLAQDGHLRIWRVRIE